MNNNNDIDIDTTEFEFVENSVRNAFSGALPSDTTMASIRALARAEAARRTFAASFWRRVRFAAAAAAVVMVAGICVFATVGPAHRAKANTLPYENPEELLSDLGLDDDALADFEDELIATL